MRSIFNDPTMLLCCLFLLGGVIQDLVMRKVKNKYVLFSLVTSILFLILNSISNSNTNLNSFSSFFSELDHSNLILIYKNLFLSLFLTFTLYIFNVIGAGDAKLFTAISTLLPLSSIAPSLFCALIWGSLLGLFKTILSGQLPILISRVLVIPQMLIFRSQNSNLIKVNSESFSSVNAIPFTIPLLLGVLTQYSLIQIGVSFL